jgi:pyruvate-ferredoxin/flavodoxin oxidoreductase
MVVGGRYGLGSKDFTPAMAKAVFDNLLADKPRDKFTVGITGRSCSAAKIVAAAVVCFVHLTCRHKQ